MKLTHKSRTTPAVKYSLAAVVFMISGIISFAQVNTKGHLADKPLFKDPVHDGAADPTIIWNVQKKVWWMFYTNRRADMQDSTGVRWVHGTRIGIAESKDGAAWRYVDTADINYRPDSGYTFWAPDITLSNGVYHMFVTYVPGIFSNWEHPRVILHCTSKDLIHWTYESTLDLITKKVIDPCSFQLPDGTWRLWYNDEVDSKAIDYADSKDLYHWVDKGKAIDAHGEGPKVFKWHGTYFMIVDVWKGMDVYQSDDLLNWKRQNERILEVPGKGPDDGSIGGHCEVIVNQDHAYVYYFIHPDRTRWKVPGANPKRSLIQVAELKYDNGQITCNRDEPVYIDLKH